MRKKGKAAIDAINAKLPPLVFDPREAELDWLTSARGGLDTVASNFLKILAVVREGLEARCAKLSDELKDRLA